MSNGMRSLPDVTELGKQELEAAYTKTFDDSWVEKAKRARGASETLEFKRRLQDAVLEARAKELEDIVTGMRDNEAELRNALRDVEDAKQDVKNIAGYIGAVTKLIVVFEKALSLVGGVGIL